MADDAKPSCEQIIDIMVDPFVVIDRDFRIVAANRAYRERYGAGPDGVIGRRCHEVNGEHCPHEEVFRHKRPTQAMHVHFDRDGGEETVQLHASPLLGDDGDVRYVGETIFRVAPPQAADDASLIGRSPPLLRMTSLLQRVAPTQTTVLLLGESGVGKEQVARYLHHYSSRAHGPFVVIDCAALGESLIERELFGHEKGSFTGASQRTRGLFEAAHGGTLFIDEIGELPLPLQARLLRALETGAIRRIGGTDYVKVDVRIVAATNRDLRQMVADGLFRQDLYYRLSAFPITVPPLRERKDDIPRLAEHFLSRMEDADRHLPLSAEAIEALLAYDYPGNVRELRNVVERAAILACDDALSPAHVVFDEPRRASVSPARRTVAAALPRERRPARATDDDIAQALRECGGHRADAAARLGISERTLYRRLRRSMSAVSESF